VRDFVSLNFSHFFVHTKYQSIFCTFLGEVLLKNQQRERNDADEDFNDDSDDENDRGPDGGASSSSSKSSSFLNAESKRGGGFLLRREIVVECKDDDFLIQKFRGSAKALRENVKVVYYLVVVFLFEKRARCNCRHLFV